MLFAYTTSLVVVLLHILALKSCLVIHIDDDVAIHVHVGMGELLFEH